MLIRVRGLDRMNRRASDVVRRSLFVIRNSSFVIRHSSSKGFSLVEILIAVTIMVIALVPIMESITASFQSSRAGEDNTILVNYAREKMEDVLAMDFDDVNSSLDDTVTFFGKTVARDVTVEYYDGNGDSIPDNDLKKITVIVEGVQLETLLAN